jgi:hypothetical protein
MVNITYSETCYSPSEKDEIGIDFAGESFDILLMDIYICRSMPRTQLIFTKLDQLDIYIKTVYLYINTSYLYHLFGNELFILYSLISLELPEVLGSNCA